MIYHFKVHKEENGYWAECLELKGCQTQADEIKELYSNMEEALNLYLDEPETSDYIFPLPDPARKGRSVIEVAVDPKIAFAMTIRMLRIKKKMTQKEIAHLLGMRNLYSYQRLENAQKSNPTLSMLGRIQGVFPEFKVDELLSRPEKKNLENL